MNTIVTHQSDTEIWSSWIKLMRVLFIVIVITLGCWLIVAHKIGHLSQDDPRYWVLCFGVVFCALTTLLMAWKLLRGSKVVYRISSKGTWINDRNGGTVIPWALVSGISRSSLGEQTFIVLEMTDQSYASLKWGSISTALFKMNKYLNVTGMALTASSTTVSTDALEAIVRRYYNNWKMGIT